MILKKIMDLYNEGIALAKEGRSRREIDALKAATLPDGRPDKRTRMLAEIAAKARLGTGNPTGSAWGKCSSQMQMLRYKDITKPEYIQARGIMTFENGDLVEAWLKERVQIAYPGMAGLEEKVFYFKVPVTEQQAKEIARRIKLKYGSKGAIWGMVRDDFDPPYLRQNQETKKIEFRMTANQMAGFVMDLKNRILWAPTYIDQAVMHGEVGLTILEDKAMSSYAFRRALVGDLDYQKRAQLAGIYTATGCNVSMIGYRKDTAHLVEIFYGRGEKRTRVNILRSNGQQETYWVEAGKYVQEVEQMALGGAIETKEVDFPADQDWEAAEVWVPADESLLQEMRDRIIRTLLATPGAWWREYGPDFTCPVCQGTGIQTLAKTTGLPLKDGGKPCTDCGGHWIQAGGTRRLGDGEKKLPGATIQAGTGKLEEAALPAFPCGYCPVVKFCWKDAEVRLEITDKPQYIVKREAFEKSGIKFHPVVPVEALPATEEDAA